MVKYVYDAWGNCLTTVHDVNATGIRGAESVPLETLEKSVRCRIVRLTILLNSARMMLNIQKEGNRMANNRDLILKQYGDGSKE